MNHEASNTLPAHRTLPIAAFVIPFLASFAALRDALNIVAIETSNQCPILGCIHPFVFFCFSAAPAVQSREHQRLSTAYIAEVFY